MLAHLAKIFGLLIVGLVLVQPAFAKPTYFPLTLARALQQDAADQVPARFDIDKVGKPFAIVHYLPHLDIWAHCGRHTYACELTTGAFAYPQIVIDADMSEAVRKLVLHHEYAHVLGWRH